mmetsp:Transcript_9770/g.27088  ORF Transcript_9770/g.27088 Transcript_9770/m.27088 type:complete len:597 (+) Transcript_9770:139-1929(+)
MSNSTHNSTVSAPPAAAAVPNKEPTCSIDTHILNEETLPEMTNIALSFFASACGKNRGAFVLDPPDGQTYGCLNLPANLPKLAGATDMLPGIKIESANDIKEQYEGGNLTAHDTLQMLDFLVQRVYDSTGHHAQTPYACEVSGLAKLDCHSSSSNGNTGPLGTHTPIRSVNLAGLFVPAVWATGGTELSLEQAMAWYGPKDFEQMNQLGLNAVQITIPTAAFTRVSEEGEKLHQALTQLLTTGPIQAGLQTILVLQSTGDEVDAVVAAAKYCKEYHKQVLGLTLPNNMNVDTNALIAAIRVQAPTVPLFVPLNEGDLTTVNGEFDDLVFGALQISHSATIADIASSSSPEDRSKLFYHEATSCILRSPLEYAACFRDMPIFLSSGFDLSIDDCFQQNIVNDFQDYGQCDRFNETTTSGWWHRHRQSYAARQLFAYEQGLGWSFAAWKLYTDEDDDSVGVLDTPAKLLSLRDVVAAGLFPDMNNDTVALDACLNPPEADFAMGDTTYAPTMGPPPDCGNGWWNYTTEKCDYWIPPPEPTPSPTKGCPVCDECGKDAAAALGTSGALLVGVIVGGLVTGLVMRALGNDKRSEYTPIPN